MATNHKDIQTFSQDADTILRLFTSREYFEQKYAQTTQSCEILECTHSGNTFRIRARLKMRTEAPVPAFAKKFIGDTMTVIQQDTWDTQAQRGRLEIEIVGAPISVSADMRLESAAQGATNTMDWTIACNIPLIGGKVEKMILNDIMSKAPRDLEASRKIAAAGTSEP